MYVASQKRCGIGVKICSAKIVMHFMEINERMDDS